MASTLRIDVEPRISALGDVAQRIEEFCERNEVPTAFSFKVNLVVEELITNSMTHAEFGENEPAITVSLEWEDGEFRVHIEDNAEPFDPFGDIPAPDLDSEISARRIGGLGIHLVRNMMDRADYEREDGLNRIRLVSKPD